MFPGFFSYKEEKSTQVNLSEGGFIQGYNRWPFRYPKTGENSLCPSMVSFISVSCFSSLISLFKHDCHSCDTVWPFLELPIFIWHRFLWVQILVTESNLTRLTYGFIPLGPGAQPVYSQPGRDKNTWSMVWLPLTVTIWKREVFKKYRRASKWSDICYTHHPSTNAICKHTVCLSINHCFDYIDSILPFNKHFTGYFTRRIINVGLPLLYL